MWIAVVVALISLIPFGWMLSVAISEGLGFFVLPLVVLELLFLLAVACIWRALTDDDDEPAPRPRYFAQPDEEMPHRMRQADTSQGSRASGLADWWFNGLRDSRRQG
jgi:hypothetical protein